ncbi:unnamed protein product [Rhizopus microsporus]
MKSFQFAIITFTASLGLLKRAACEFDPKSHNNVIHYWGQNSASMAGNDLDHTLWQKPLAEYCDREELDMLVISFLHKFGEGRLTSFDIANSGKNCTGFFPGTELLNCPQMENDIKYCQGKGKKILLSLGGATPEYGLDSIESGQNFADELWNTFGAGQHEHRPFGNAVVDGFDLDIENGAKAGYPAFINRMREHYSKDTSKQYFISGAPQCPYPDYYLGEALDTAWFDFVMIQFYNNYCNVINGPQFNYNTWDEWARTKSINKDVRLFVGIPGSPSAAGRGYVPYKQLVSMIKPLQQLMTFGGIMVWDVSQAYGNTMDVLPSYAHGIAQLIHSNTTLETVLAPESTTIATMNTVSQSPATTAVVMTTTISPIETASAETNTIDMTTNRPNEIRHGEPCLENGALKCSGESSYGQCTNGYWVVRNCPVVTVCKENNNSIFCGFP